MQVAQYVDRRHFEMLNDEDDDVTYDASVIEASSTRIPNISHRLFACPRVRAPTCVTPIVRPLAPLLSLAEAYTSVEF